jgi:hypothetical protein
MSRAGSIRIPSMVLGLGATLLCACPSQELAPLAPCVISAANVDVAQNGVDKVDVLFVVDNSGSMAQEQAKLSQQLQRLVSVLATGKREGQPDFQPVASLHLGVISSDMGVHGQPNITSCAKDFGDNGALLSSVQVAVQGVVTELDGVRTQAIAPRPECANVSVNRFLEFERGKSDPVEVARQFGCIAELGVQGCGFEQQLESTLRALAPSTNTSFSRGSAGQGAPGGFNASFLREDAVLVVIMVSDEEDCSSPDASRDILYRLDPNAANVLCTRNPQALHPVSRYVEGLLSLKRAAYSDRIIFAGIVGVPTASSTANKSLDQILAMPEMAVREDGLMRLGLIPSCVASNDAGRADPARRMVEVAKGFGKNGVITSICEDDYGPALNAVIAKIADKLSGACLPRQLKVNSQGLVECKVVEVKAASDKVPCAQTRGRNPVALLPRSVGGSERIACEVNQLAVLGGKAPSGDGWFYDNFSESVLKSCPRDKQRIAFAPSSPLSDGAQARVECQTSVVNITPMSLGVEAVNTPCVDDGSDAPKGDAKCQKLSIPGESLLCVQGTCQLSCQTKIDCPPALTCTPDALGRGFCTNPTCPISESDPQAPDATVPAGP